MRGSRRFAVVAAFAVFATAASAEFRFQVAQDRLTTLPTAMFLAGSFNGMSTSTTPLKLDGDTWWTEVALPDGRHFYKFYYVDQNGKGHWMNDPLVPCLADNGKSGANNFVDVRGGNWAFDPSGLEKFQWDGNPDAKWVCVAGDFNDWYLGQFRLARQENGTWLGYLPIKRPYAYKIIIDGIWRQDVPGRYDAIIPNGIGGRNSFRAQREVTLPSDVTISRKITPGDRGELDKIETHAKAADYGRAVALARKVAEVNAAASGATAPLVLESLDLEGQIHKRWNRWDDAAVCWKRLADSKVMTTATLHGIKDLSNYYLYLKRDYEAGRFLNEIAVANARDHVELVMILHHWYSLNLRQGNMQMTIDSMEETMSQLPDPGTQDKQYGCELSELWLIKAIAHVRLGQYKKARECYLKIIEVHPYDDGLNVIRARRWLESHDEEGRPLPRNRVRR